MRIGFLLERERACTLIKNCIRFENAFKVTYDERDCNVKVEVIRGNFFFSSERERRIQLLAIQRDTCTHFIVSIPSTCMTLLNGNAAKHRRDEPRKTEKLHFYRI